MLDSRNSISCTREIRALSNVFLALFLIFCIRKSSFHASETRAFIFVYYELLLKFMCSDISRNRSFSEIFCASEGFWQIFRASETRVFVKYFVLKFNFWASKTRFFVLHFIQQIELLCYSNSSFSFKKIVLLNMRFCQIFDASESLTFQFLKNELFT